MVFVQRPLEYVKSLKEQQKKQQWLFFKTKVQVTSHGVSGKCSGK